MRPSRLRQDSDFAILAALALTAVLLHTLTNSQHGFHRDDSHTRRRPLSRSLTV
jgi:hypothetical protein